MWVCHLAAPRRCVLFAIALLTTGCSEEKLQPLSAELVVTPERISFVRTVPGSSTAAVRLSAKAAAVTVTDVRLTHDSNFDLSLLDLPALPFTVARNAPVNISVHFLAEGMGEGTGLIQIESSANGAEVPIDMSVDLQNGQPNIPPCIAPRNYSPVQLWNWTGVGDINPESNGSHSGIAVAQLTDDNDDGLFDGQDIPDVVFVTYTNPFSTTATVRALSGDTGEGIWAREHYATLGGHPAIADIDGDGKPEIVLSGAVGGPVGTAKFLVLDHGGNELFQSERFTRPDQGESTIQIVDLEGDGTPEILIGNIVFNNDGTVRWEGQSSSASVGVYPSSVAPYPYGSSSFAADLDGDGYQEVIAGRTTYDWDGTTRWDPSNVVDGPVAVADCDGDGEAEIFVQGSDVGGDAPISLLEHDGTVSVASLDTTYDAACPSLPAAADLDGDGAAEFIVAYHSTLVAYRCDTNLPKEDKLQVTWSTAVYDHSGCSGPVVFDFEGDGAYEVVFADEQNVRIISGNGNVVFTGNRYSDTYFDTPVIADVNNDGHADILVSNTFVFGGIQNPEQRGLTAYTNAGSDWVATGRMWNQGSFVSTNIEENGAVPSAPLQHWRVANLFRGNLPICEASE